jgi:hypothetical protein
MTVLAGMDVLASHIKRVKTRNKAATEGVTSSATPQNDNDFVIPLEAGKTYRIELFLHCQGATAGDIRTSWTTSGTITSNGRSLISLAETMTSAADANAISMSLGLTDQRITGTEATLTTVIYEDLSVTCTVAGNLTLQWAQGTSSGTATNCFAVSRIYVTELEIF